MRTRRTDSETAVVARRRLDRLSAELAAMRGDAVPAADGSQPGDPTAGDDRDGDARAGPEAVPRRAVRAPDRTAPAVEHAEPVRDGTTAAPPPGRHARRPVPRRGRVAGWLHDRLPPTLQGRVALGAGHLTVVALVAATALAVTAWWVLRADGTTTVVATAGRTEPAAVPTGGPAPLATPAAAPGEPVASVGPGRSGRAEAVPIVVDVAGKVRRPGIVTLPKGSRVVDALEEAGGARKGVDLTDLNLARVLVDGEQVLVGIAPPDGVAAPAASAGGPTGGAGGGTAPAMVNVNTATAAELEELPGVGPVTAAAILEWRTEHGAFTAVDELLEVSGIGEATLADIAPHVTL